VVCEVDMHLLFDPFALDYCFMKVITSMVPWCNNGSKVYNHELINNQVIAVCPISVDEQRRSGKAPLSLLVLSSFVSLCLYGTY